MVAVFQHTVQSSVRITGVEGAAKENKSNHGTLNISSVSLVPWEGCLRMVSF